MDYYCHTSLTGLNIGNLVNHAQKLSKSIVIIVFFCEKNHNNQVYFDWHRLMRLDILAIPKIEEFLISICIACFWEISNDSSHLLFNKIGFNNQRILSSGSCGQIRTAKMPHRQETEGFISVVYAVFCLINSF